MSKYLKFLVEQNCINQNHSDGIQAMYNNITSYNFNEIFSDNDVIHSQQFRSINTGDSYNNINTLFNQNSINTPIMLSRSTILNNTNNIIIKNHIIKATYPDDFKDAIIMHLLRDAYFQDLTYKQSQIVGTSTLIIPEVLQYGSITLDNNDQIIFFTSPYYVDSSPPSFSHGNSDRYQYVLDFKNLTTIFKNGLDEFKNIMDSLQIKHNDIVTNYTEEFTEEYFDQLFQVVEENDPLKLNSIYNTFLCDSTIGSCHYNCDFSISYTAYDSDGNFNYDVVKDLPFTITGNVLKYNDKIVVIDFEHCGVSETQLNLCEICNVIINN